MLNLLTGPWDPSNVMASLNQIIQAINANAGNSGYVYYTAPIAAELVSVKAAATPANGAITVAGQPDYARKLQVRVVLGTPGTTNITAGTLTLVGTNQNGDSITEVVSLVTAVTVTITTANVFANVASGTVAGYTASGGGTGNTLGIGVSAALGIPYGAGSPIVGAVTTSAGTTGQTGGAQNFSITKENVDNANETIGTVDAVAGSVVPTTAPNATHNFGFYYKYNSQE